MFNNVFNGKKVLVTGNTGFKGSWMCAWLTSLGAEVVGVSNRIPTEPSMFEALGLDKKIKYIEADIRNLNLMIEIVATEKPDVLFHMAAQPIVADSYANPVDTFTTNVIGTTSLLEALRLSNHECYAVFITSDKCYENVEWTWGYRENDRLGGKDPYSASKAGSEIAIYSWFHSYFNQPNSKVKITSVRAGNVIGGGDWAPARIVPDCIRAWSENQPVEIRRPQATRPWQHVLEPISGYLRCAQELMSRPQELTGESFNFGPAADQSYTVLELLQEIAKNWDFPTNDEHFKVNTEGGFHEAGLLKLNCDKALHTLKWKPVLRFEEAARFTAEWYHKFYYNPDGLYQFTIDQIAEYAESAKNQQIAWAN